MNDKIIFLNQDVAREVRSDPTLYLAWRLSFPAYDDERDPLHNPDFVRGCQESEAEHLVEVKRWVQQYQAELKESQHV